MFNTVVSLYDSLDLRRINVWCPSAYSAKIFNLDKRGSINPQQAAATTSLLAWCFLRNRPAILRVADIILNFQKHIILNFIQHWSWLMLFSKLTTCFEMFFLQQWLLTWFFFSSGFFQATLPYEPVECRAISIVHCCPSLQFQGPNIVKVIVGLSMASLTSFILALSLGFKGWSFFTTTHWSTLTLGYIL